MRKLKLLLALQVGGGLQNSRQMIVLNILPRCDKIESKISFDQKQREGKIMFIWGDVIELIVQAFKFNQSKS